MSSAELPATLVARFLRANNYNQTLDAFLEEAGLPPDAGSTEKNSLTIEQILREKQIYDLSVNFEKISTDETDKGWTVPAPSKATILSLPSSANILQSSLELLRSTQDAATRCFVVAATADRRLSIVAASEEDAADVVPRSHSTWASPVLSYIVVDGRYIVHTSMSGQLTIYDVWHDETLTSRKDHDKYAVKVSLHRTTQGVNYLATCGWDKKVYVYVVDFATAGKDMLQAPICQAQMPSNPTDVLFVEDAVAQKLFLLVTRQDSSFIHYYEIESGSTSASQNADDDPIEVLLAGRQNLAPHSNAWVAFTPSAMSICPTDPGQIAVATSAVPHLKLIVVRLLFPRSEQHVSHTSQHAVLPSDAGTAADGYGSGADRLTAVSQARAELAIQDREAAAILLHCTTLAPQTLYSTPALAWRPDGSGVWVNSDDGVVRGIECKTGKIITTLKGHEPGSKLRCVWAGFESDLEQNGSRREVLISGGFDQKLILWRP